MNSLPLDLDVANNYILMTCVIRAVARMRQDEAILAFFFIIFFEETYNWIG